MVENKLTPKSYSMSMRYIYYNSNDFFHDSGQLERRKNHGLLKLETSETSVAYREEN